MKGLKKISALVLALAMMLTMVSFAGAEVTSEHVAETTSNTFTIAKDIVLFNTNSQPIYEPNVTYHFAITSVNPNGATITDDPAIDTHDDDAEHSVTVAVKQGTGGVTITGTDGNAKGVGAGNISVTFGDGAHDAAASYAYETNAEGSTVTADSKKATRNITVTIDPSSDAFRVGGNSANPYVPGVYRYHIEDTTDYSTITSAGVKHPEGGLEDLTLDVYLKWTSNEHTALQVYGYVLFRDLTENQSLTYGSSGVSTAKVTGFDIPSNMEGANGTSITSTADEYHTFNVKVSKTVDGNLADVNNAFPFNVALTGISSTEFYWTKNAETTKTLLTMGADGQTINTALKHNEYITVFGLPYNATVQATETNNTPDYYTPSATFKAGSADAAALSATEFVINNRFQPQETASTIEFKNGKSETAKTLDSALTEDVIAVTNKLTEISPTGYVARFAPYALILVAGIALLVLAKKRKPAKEE